MAEGETVSSMQSPSTTFLQQEKRARHKSDQDADRNGVGDTPQAEHSSLDLESGARQRKTTRKRIMWTNEEDLSLLHGVKRHGEGNWAAILR